MPPFGSFYLFITEPKPIASQGFITKVKALLGKGLRVKTGRKKSQLIEINKQNTKNILTIKSKVLLLILVNKRSRFISDLMDLSLKN
jgi:hypothetical protein